MRKEDLNNLVSDFITECRYDEKSEKTLIHYDHVVNLFLSSIEADEVSKADVIKFKSQLMKRFKPKTVTNYITVTNKFLKYAGLQDLAVKNIKIQQESSLEEVLEPIELKRLLRMAKKTDQLDMYYIMQIFAYTGIRAEELKVFTVENLETNYIRVTNKGKTRDIILRQDLRRELIKYCKQAGIKKGYIFKGKRENTMLHYTTIFKRMKKLAGKCRGVKKSKIHPHSFRHLFAIKFLEEGGDITELADILGHSSIDTTRIYTRTTSKMKRERMEKMKY